MGDVIDINIKRKKNTPTTDAQKIQLLKRALKAANRYIAVAVHKGVYDEWDVDGDELISFLNSLQYL